MAGLMGLNGKLPWHLPEDLQAFRQITMGAPILMGRKTFASLPGLLPGRKHIVLSSGFKSGIYASGANPEVWECDSLEFTLNFLKLGALAKVTIIGGQELFESALPFLDRIYITTVHRVIDTEGEEDLRYFPFENLYQRSGVLHKHYPVKTSVTGLRYTTAVWEKENVYLPA
jgi:dihydrofolate reductase